MQKGISDDVPMPAPRRKQFRRLYIGEWIARLGRTPREVSKDAGIGESYLSLIISGEKNNPSALVLLGISETLGLTVNDLYKPPPAPEAVQAAGQLTPSQMATLGDLLASLKTQRRKQ